MYFTRFNNMKVWCDGAFKPSLEQGGIGIVWVNDDGKVIKTYSKGFKNGKLKVTNQTMEVLAAITAIMGIKSPIESLEIITDSMYVVGTMTKNWKRKANNALWNQLDKVIKESKIKNITFRHTYGHADDEFNNIADKLADAASKEFIE